MRLRQGRVDADRRLPVPLRMHALRRAAAAEPGRLLRVLLLRLGEVPADAGGGLLPSMKRYDLVIIGTGTAAMVAAMRVRSAGWTVAIVDFRPFGGTCALRGCDPKKMLIGGVTALDHARRMRGKGIAGEVHIDWRELMAFKRSFTDPIPKKHEDMYAGKGIDTYHGRARFTGRNSIEAGGAQIESRYLLIAAGAEPVKLNIPGEEAPISSAR